MKRASTPKQFSAYLITASDEPSMAVGATLIDKGSLIQRDWEVMDFTTGKSTTAVGVRIARLCPDCRVKHRVVGMLGHDGEHGAPEVKSEAIAELRYAKKQTP